MTTTELLDAAAAVKHKIAVLDTETRNKALISMADEIEQGADEILAANKEDIEFARDKISKVMLDRLMLDKKRVTAMADGMRDVAKLPDPVGRMLGERQIRDGLFLRKVSVPLGVVAIIYESRPNVTSDAAALCIKSGNVCVLRSGKEASRSAKAITALMKKGLERAGMCPDFIGLVEDTSRDSATELMKARGKVDLLIPRGGAGLIRSCIENATVPCIETGTGICTVYVDSSADIKKALDIIENAKTSRPSVCNAEEICLVANDIAGEFLPLLKKRLVDDRSASGKQPVELRICKNCGKYIEGTVAGPEDFDTEFLDYILAVKIVEDVHEAVDHIREHSTGHSESIIASDRNTIQFFTDNVDSAAVYVNASTRFTDGGEFGLGCEMGISTQKLHARGPMGLEELCSYKYIITGDGHIR